jgi:hypothetical protein
MFLVKSINTMCTFITIPVIGITVAADFMVMKMTASRNAFDSNCIAGIIDCNSNNVIYSTSTILQE